VLIEVIVEIENITREFAVQLYRSTINRKIVIEGASNMNQFQPQSRRLTSLGFDVKKPLGIDVRNAGTY
jgi:hypothetical protein